MNPAVLSGALAFAARANAAGHISFVGNAADWNRISAEIGGVVPAWYIELMTTVALAGLEIKWQESEQNQPEDTIHWIEWFDAQNVRLEALELHPGKTILGQGYFCVAGSNCAGDQYFISIHDGDDPPLFQIDHETDEDPEEILTTGRHLVAPSLSELFRRAETQTKPSQL